MYGTSSNDTLSTMTFYLKFSWKGHFIETSLRATLLDTLLGQNFYCGFEFQN